jgi:hypothetical protein
MFPVLLLGLSRTHGVRIPLRKRTDEIHEGKETLLFYSILFPILGALLSQAGESASLKTIIPGKTSLSDFAFIHLGAT